MSSSSSSSSSAPPPPPPDAAAPADPVEAAEALEIEKLARDLRRARGFTTAARRALSLARRYREEEGAAHGEREEACVKQALAWRTAARDLRRGADMVGPGIARTSAPPPSANRQVS